jgi:hypothetical protein
MSTLTEEPVDRSPDSAAVEGDDGSGVALASSASISDGDAMTDAAAAPPSSSSPSSSARRCNCKNSRCLKLYCECFAAGSYCNSLCKCKCCLNTKRHMPERQAAIKATLERNAFAFQPKISTAPASEKQLEDPGRHLKGCNCKKSNCLKKYCECFQAGVVCSSSCKCVDCLNFEGDALAAAKCRVPDRDRSKPSPKPLKRKSSHASSSSKVMSWDTALRNSFAEPSDASLQLQSCLQRGGSFVSKMFDDSFFEAIHHAPAVKDALALGGVEGIEALLRFLNPLLETIAERATREAAAAAAVPSRSGRNDMEDNGDRAAGQVKEEEDSEQIDSELDEEDGGEEEEAEEEGEEGGSAETDGDDDEDSDIEHQDFGYDQHGLNEKDVSKPDVVDPMSPTHRPAAAAEEQLPNPVACSDRAAAASEDDVMGGP